MNPLIKLPLGFMSEVIMSIYFQLTSLQWSTTATKTMDVLDISADSP